MHIEYKNVSKGTIAFIELIGIEPNNTLTGEIILDFYDTLQEACKHADGIIVHSTNEKFFCNGMDGLLLSKQSQETQLQWISTMTSIYPKLIQIPKPWMVELAGHTMAGGAVLASAADYRIMLNKGGRIGFSEILIGIPLPMSYIIHLENICVPSSIRTIIYGKAYKPLEAQEIGLIDEVVLQEDTQSQKTRLRAASLKYMNGLLRLPQESLLSMRAKYKAKIVHSMQEALKKDLDYLEIFIKSSQFKESVKNIIKKN